MPRGGGGADYESKGIRLISYINFFLFVFVFVFFLGGGGGVGGRKVQKKKQNLVNMLYWDYDIF